MASQTVRLTEETRRALRRTLGEVPVQAEPVHVELPEGAPPVDGPDEVFVLVLGPQGGLASRRSLSGRKVDLRELSRLLVGAEAAVERLALTPTTPSPPLTEAEASLLDEAGLVEGGGWAGAVEKSLIEFELLLRQSLTLAKAARILDVNESRLRQRLSAHTLYGIKDGRSWKVPTFQFDPKRKKLVRGIDKVLPHVHPDAHPLAVVRWFSTPHQDLVLGQDEQPVTPLQWLAGGGTTETVAELAEEI
jgi:hypothetical protein